MNNTTLEQHRAKHVPVDAEIVRDEKSTAVAYLYIGTAGASKGKPCVRAFSGRKQKPTIAYYYETEEQRDAAMNRFFDTVSKQEADRKERKATATAAENAIEVGTILYASWGWEQTNIDFYQVVEVSKTGKSVKVVELAQNREYTGDMQGSCMPVKNCFTSDVSGSKRISAYGGITMDSVRWARVWDGRPKSWSSYA